MKANDIHFSKYLQNVRKHSFCVSMLSPYSHVCPLSHKLGHKCTTNVWFAHVFKLSFSGAFACARIYAQNIALKTKERPFKFQSRVLESP